MKKLFKYALLCAALCTLSMSFTACSSDDDNKSSETTDPNQGRSAADIVYSQQNAAAWGNYMVAVAKLLNTDASKLYDMWNGGTNYGGSSYASYFKSHNNKDFSSALNCVEQIIDGCVTIASEVGSTKIGDPYNLYVAGKTTEALYAVESWYSWHSITDYANNIRSIRNAYLGSRDGSVNANSLSAVLAKNNPNLDNQTKAAIQAAIDKIEAIPDPFRNNINSKQSQEAMDACGDLSDFLGTTLKSYFQNTAAVNSDAVLDPVVKQYVDGVVVPTYLELKNANASLLSAVQAFQKSPSNAGFEACAKAWLVSREPWEASEAFLFGPVTDLGLDPNMDSWPLDQAGIVKVLSSQAWKEMEWTGDFDEDNTEIAAAQALRGFHTLEFLVFRDGKARTLND